MKRIFDILLGLPLLLLLAVPTLIILFTVRLTSQGPSLYWSDRVGINNVIFSMPKVRTMLNNTPTVATHLLDNSHLHLTKIGSFLRRSSLDELPQLFSVLKGEMSFVGPRPALYNQADLIALRKAHGVDKILPGITGWAQVNGRDNLSIADKVALDTEYLEQRSLWFDLKILWMTFLKVVKKEGVLH